MNSLGVTLAYVRFLVPKFIKPFWLRMLIENILVAVIIAAIISIFTLIVTGSITLEYYLYSFLFSFLIGYFISLGVCQIQNIGFIKEQQPWVRWVAYYTVTMVCMLIATELGRFIISRSENFIYIFLGSTQSILFNAAIAFIATTIIGVYQSQQERFHLHLTRNELDILKMQQSKTNAELETLQSRINPHFLYNSLNSIASLIHHEPDMAEEMTLRLSKLFRYSINSQNENKTTVKDEIDIVQNYMAIETLRFGDRISFEVNADPDLSNHLIPRFLIQPLVENAIKHGLQSVVKNGQICIDLGRESDKLIIAVTDNGVPFPENLQAGYGMQSTYDKLNLLYSNNYSLELINAPKKQIRIKIPIDSK